MAGSVRVPIITTLKDSATGDIEKKLGGIKTSLNGLSKFAKVAAGALAAVGAVDFVRDSVEQGKLLEQNLLGLNTVFGSLSPQMEAFTKTTAEYGISASEAAQAGTFLGSVLQQYGIAGQRAATETQNLTKLAADLAFTYGYDVQEALVAITALFRGEYDPIEKFGVAMKQNEIESVKAARGLEKLTGQAELNADANIRLELLMQRTTAAQGAFERGSGTLAAEQEKLRASFENLQASLGQQLTPAIADAMEAMRPLIDAAGPALVGVFEALAQVAEWAAGMISDAQDPTTVFGESIAALQIQANSLWNTFFGQDFDIGQIFEAATYLANLFVNALHDIIRVVENIALALQAVGIMWNAIITGDWETAKKGAQGIYEELVAARDASYELEMQQRKTNAEFAETLRLANEAVNGALNVGEESEIWNNIGRTAQTAGETAGEDYAKGVSAGIQKARNVVEEFWANLYDEIDKQNARGELQILGLSEALIDSIIGVGEGWKELFESIIAGGATAAAELQALFNQTAAGIAEMAKAAGEAVNEQANNMVDWLSSGPQILDQATTAFAAMTDQVNLHNEAVMEARDSVAALLSSYTDTFAAADGMNAMERAVVDLTTALDALVAATDTSILSSRNQAKLTAFVASSEKQMRDVAKLRGEIADEIARTEARRSEMGSLFDSIYQSIVGEADITKFGGSSNNIIKQLQRTVDQARLFQQQLADLRAAGLSQTALQQIQAAGATGGSATAQALLRGGESAIEEVNALLGELDAIATTAGTRGVESMYGVGLDAVDSLIEGLYDDQDRLADVAEDLARNFATAFQTAFNQGTVLLEAPSLGAFMDYYNQVLDNVKFINDNWEQVSSPAAGGGREFLESPENLMRIGLPVPVRPTPGQSGGNITININAGIGTNGAELGQYVVEAINRYENTSGRVFARA